jgi:hypothetical protein
LLDGDTIHAAATSQSTDSKVFDIVVSGIIDARRTACWIAALTSCWPAFFLAIRLSCFPSCFLAFGLADKHGTR